MTAKEVNNHYKNLLEEERRKALQGSNEAAINIMKLMTEQNIKLKELGYRLTDEGKLARITKKWIAQKLSEESLSDRLTREYRQTGDPEILRRLFLEVWPEMRK